MLYCKTMLFTACNHNRDNVKYTYYCTAHSCMFMFYVSVCARFILGLLVVYDMKCVWMTGYTEWCVPNNRICL